MEDYAGIGTGVREAAIVGTIATLPAAPAAEG
jgi:hypothetical protein